MEYTIRPRHVVLLKPLVQFFAFVGGVAVCLTRISDYFHHWSDVLAGYIIGLLLAYYVVRRPTKIFVRYTLREVIYCPADLEGGK